MALSASAIILVTAGFLSCLIAIPPLIIQVQQRNAAFCILIVAVIILNFTRAVNGLIWHTENLDSWWEGRVFCDLEIRIHLILEMAIPGAAVCIFRQLSLVFHPSQCSTLSTQNRRRKILEFVLCVLNPVLWTVAIFLVQPDRYWIAGSHGCIASIDTGWPGFAIAFVWPLLLSTVGLFYGSVTTYRIFRHKREIGAALDRYQSRRNRSRTGRVCVFGLVLFLTLVPYQVYALYKNIFLLYYKTPSALDPDPWSRIHPPDWAERIVKLNGHNNTFRLVLVDYLNVFYSISVFACLGFTSDAVETYKSWLARSQSVQRLLTGRAIPPRSSTALPIINGADVHRQATGRYELDALSGHRRDQGTT